MKFRRATPADRSAVLTLATRAVSRDPLPLKVSRDRMAQTFDTVVAGNQHCALVSEDDDGKVVAALLAHVAPGFWFERMQADVLMFYTEHPGAGLPLMREFARWVKARPIIKMATFSLERDADPRIAKLLDKLGFNQRFPQHVYVRGLQ